MPAPRVLPLLVVLSFLIAPATVAQIPNRTDTTATPAPGGHDYLVSPVETVNPANGSVSIRIPVRMVQSRQTTIPFSFAYDSNGAFYFGEQPGGGTPRYLSTYNNLNSIGGWSYSYPVMSFAGGSWTIPGSLDNNITCYGSTNYVFQDESGNRHNLRLSVSANLASPDGIDNCNQGLDGDGEFPTGGEGPIAASTSIPGSNTKVFPGVTVTDGNGTSYTFPGGGPIPNGLTTLATTVSDRNGNEVALSRQVSNYPPVTYTDTIGRTALSVSGMGANPDTVTLKGLSSPYKVYWGTASASFTNSVNNLPGATSNCATSWSGGSNVVSSIVLPDGRQFSFSYDPTYGMISKIVYPSGGYVRYVWGLNSLAEAGSWAYSANSTTYSWACQYGFPAVTDRYLSFDGSSEVLHQHFSYYTQWQSNTSTQWNYKTTTVTTYDLVRGTNFTTTYSYSPIATEFVPNCGSCLNTGQVPTEQTIQYNDFGGANLRTVTKNWKNIRLLQSEQTKLDNGQSFLKVYCYNSSEEVTEADEYDLGTGTPSGNCAGVPSGTQSGALLRRTATSYASFTQHIVDLPSTVITYDGSGSRVAETDSPSYDANGNLLTQTKDCFALPGGGGCAQGNSTIRYTYDSHGQILTMVDPRNNTTSYSYTDSYSGCGGNAPPSSPSGAYLTQVTYPQTNGVNHVVSYCYDYSTGLMLSSADENGQTSTYQYADSLDRLTQANYADGGQVTHSYNDSGPSPTETVTKKLNSSQTVTTVTTKNGLGDVVQTQITSDPQGTITTRKTLDGMGLDYQVYNPYRSTSDPTYGYTTYAYDALGRTKTVTKPDNSVVTTQYCGQETLVTDEAGHWRRSKTDGLARLIEVDEPNSTTAAVNVCPGAGEPIWVTTYAYDGLNDLTSVVQGSSRNRSFTYDSLKHLTQSTNPESGTISYAYDPNGNVTTKTDARNITGTYAYDALNRTLQVSYNDVPPTPTVTYTYDQSSCLGQPSCYNIGHRTTMNDAGGTQYFAYDQMGREIAEQRTTGTVTRGMVYHYDPGGDLTTLVYPSGRIINYTYDSAGRPSVAQDGQSGTNYAYGSCVSGAGSNGACYAPHGAISQLQTGTNVVTTYIFNVRLQPCWIYATTGTSLATNTSCTASDPSPGTIADIQYNFNLGHDNGNVLSIANNRNSLRTQTISYDQLNRIVNAQSNATYSQSPSLCWGEAYSYDQWANLLANDVSSSSFNGCVQDSPFSNAVTNKNQFSGYPYDLSGNVVNDGHSYVWNAESEIQAAAGVNYTYDGDGNRIAKSSGTLYWYGLGGEILGESDAYGNMTNEYVFFGGKRIARIAY